MARFERDSAVDEKDDQQPAPQGEVPRSSILQVIWRRRWIVLGAVAASLVTGLAYLMHATPIYKSASRVYVEKSFPKILSGDQGFELRSENYLNTQCEVIMSTPILAVALEQAGATKMRTFAGVDNPIGLMKAAMTADVGKKDDIISVSFVSPYPEEAAQIVNAVVDSYVTYNSKQKKSTAAEVLRILQNEKVKRDGEFDAKIKGLMDFREANPALSFESEKGANVIIQRLSRLSDATTTAQLEAIEAKALYETAKAVSGDPVKMRQLVESQRSRAVVAAVNDEDRQLRQELRQLQAQLAALREEIRADHPAVQAAEKLVAQKQKEIDEAGRRFAAGQVEVAALQFATAQEKEKQAREYYDLQQKEAIGLNTQLAKYSLLQADLDQTRKLCDILNDRIKEIKVTEDVGALNISILEVAKVEGAAYSPQKARTMAIALAIGLMLGVGLSLVRDWMDQRLRSSEEIAALLGIPVLGVVPSMSTKETVSVRGQMVNNEPTSPVAEAYRTIRTAVYFGVPAGQAKKILITSPSPGDGKTTLVSNLAISMAQAGQRTLVLDADFRKPMQHKIFEVKDDDGLSSLLAGRISMDKAVLRTKIENLDILPCGPIPPNPSEILNSQAFADLLDELAKTYDHILIDSPPVMPVTDARIIGAMCGTTLLVLRAEKSTRKSAELARDGLMSVGAHILGTVVNDVQSGGGRYGYYSGYGYGYYKYGYGGKSRRKDGQETPEEAKAAD